LTKHVEYNPSIRNGHYSNFRYLQAHRNLLLQGKILPTYFLGSSPEKPPEGTPEVNLLRTQIQPEDAERYREEGEALESFT